MADVNNAKETQKNETKISKEPEKKKRRPYKKRNDIELLNKLQVQIQKVNRRIVSKYKDDAMGLFMIVVQDDIDTLIDFFKQIDELETNAEKMELLRDFILTHSVSPKATAENFDLEIPDEVAF